MQNFKTEYKDYRDYNAIMISTDRNIFNEHSSVRKRMIEYASRYKELHIIIFSTKKFEVEEIAPNYKIYGTNSYTRWNYVKDARKIGKIILKNLSKEIPLLVTCQDPFETGLVGKCLANLRENSELLLQIHVDLFNPYFARHSILNRIRLYISKFTLPYAQVIRVVSYKIANSLVQRGYNPEKIIIKPIEVDTEYIKNSKPAFILKEKYNQFEKIILVASRLEKEKNIEMALRALKLISDKLPKVGLIVVGSGKELRRLQKLAYNLKIDPKVVFVGWQTDLVPYYKGADIFLSTSWYEGYGMVFKEAQAAGCKIVSTDVGIAKEVGAEIVDWNEKEIVEKIIGILNK
jgi:glycosyltransferase involved in cell wall biosynthesis